MLLEKINKTRELMNEVNELQEKEGQYHQYKDFYEHFLNETTKGYEFVDAQISLIDQYSLVFKNPDLSSIINKLNDLLTSFVHEPKKGRITSIFRDLEQDHKNKLAEKWFEFAQVESYDAISTLNNVLRITGSSAEISQIINSLQALSNKWPLSEKHVKHFKEQCNNAKLKIDDLNVSEEVQSFLKLVSHQKSTAADLTPRVIEWLKENDFGQNLTIRFK